MNHLTKRKEKNKKTREERKHRKGKIKEKCKCMYFPIFKGEIYMTIQYISDIYFLHYFSEVRLLRGHELPKGVYVTSAVHCPVAVQTLVALKSSLFYPHFLPFTYQYCIMPLKYSPFYPLVLRNLPFLLTKLSLFCLWLFLFSILMIQNNLQTHQSYHNTYHSLLRICS